MSAKIEEVAMERNSFEVNINAPSSHALAEDSWGRESSQLAKALLPVAMEFK